MKRQYFGQAQAAPLIKFLNSAGDRAEPLARLIGLYAERRKVMRPVSRAAQRRMSAALGIPAELAGRIQRIPSVDIAKEGLEAAATGLTGKINAILNQVCLTPMLVGSVRGYWKIQWHGHQKAHRMKEELVPQALFALLDLAAEGVLDRVKCCANPKCGRWMYALLPQAKFHSEGCQRRAYEASPDRRERRRQWARKYYRDKLSS